MAVGEGRFVLYSRIEPPLTADDYRFDAEQRLEAGTDSSLLGPGDLPIARLRTHVRVRSPRFALPPDQVLSTFPPARSAGNYGARLPQVVLRRRTLPWERAVGSGAVEGTPWLALVLIAEGEAQLERNLPVAECLTPGVELTGPADSAAGACLRIRKSMMDRIFPSQSDVALLAHAREVDLDDTELMLGDDDGYLAVVVANRLPLPGRDASGAETPVQYSACLVNLEGQFHTLPVRASAASKRTSFPAPRAPLPTLSSAASAAAGTDVYAEMARDFADGVATAGFVATPDAVALDRTLTFPVLLHWSFTSYGNDTFESLMQGLDSGLLGTVGAGVGAGGERSGRPPLEVAETGHVGLAHRIRRGDLVRSWYRGPLVAHPMTQAPADRLALAHCADQVRIVVPDGSASARSELASPAVASTQGREDISLAAAFEIGRLLALARPAMVAALLHWRQRHYQVGRSQVVWTHLSPVLAGVLGPGYTVDARLGVRLGRQLVHDVVARLEQLAGLPRPLVTPGRRLEVDGSVARALTHGLRLDPAILRGEPEAMIERLRAASVRRVGEAGEGLTGDSALLSATLAAETARLAAEVLGLPAQEGEPP